MWSNLQRQRSIIFIQSFQLSNFDTRVPMSQQWDTPPQHPIVCFRISVSKLGGLKSGKRHAFCTSKMRIAALASTQEITNIYDFTTTKRTLARWILGVLHVQGSIAAIAVNNFDVNIWVPGCPRIGPAKLFSAPSNGWCLVLRCLSNPVFFWYVQVWPLAEPQWKIAYDTLLHPKLISSIQSGESEMMIPYHPLTSLRVINHFATWKI